MKAQNRPDIPLDMRVEIKFPCDIHGDPRRPPADILLAVWIYGKMPGRIDLLTLEATLRLFGINKNQLLHYLWLIEEIENALA